MLNFEVTDTLCYKSFLDLGPCSRSGLSMVDVKLRNTVVTLVFKISISVPLLFNKTVTSSMFIIKWVIDPLFIECLRHGR